MRLLTELFCVAFVVHAASASHRRKKEAGEPNTSANLIIYRAMSVSGGDVSLRAVFSSIRAAIPDAPITLQDVEELYIDAATSVSVPVEFHDRLVELKQRIKEDGIDDDIVDILRSISPSRWEQYLSDDEIARIAKMWYKYCVSDQTASILDPCKLLQKNKFKMTLSKSMISEYFARQAVIEQRALNRLSGRQNFFS